jgi:hypothetical protein
MASSSRFARSRQPILYDDVAFGTAQGQAREAL